ncbi:MAG: hypothetical protein GY867_12370 [bacterium]|nr:hypothetical protein [bacterium]
MLNKIINNLVLCGRVLVVFMALFALCVSGAGAAERIFSPPETAAENVASPSLNHQLVSVPDPEAAPEGMADVGRPCTEPAAFIQAPMLLVSNHLQLKTQLQTLQRTVVSSQCKVCGTNSCLPATSCRVSWSLGRQFTLVGAKPSGTS